MNTKEITAPEVKNPESRLSSLERTGLFILLFVLFAFGLFDHSLWTADDNREGAIISDMFMNGTWITPTLNGESYTERPPLLQWTGLAFCHLFGKVNEGLVRLPAGIYGLGAVFIAYLFGRRFGRERAGFAAAFMCGTSILYLEYSKTIHSDTALAFMVILSLYLFWNAYTAQQNRMLKYIFFLVVSALSFYAKGFPGPGFVWVSVGLFLLYQKKWKLLLCLSIPFTAVFIIAVMPLAYALWNNGGIEHVKTVLWTNQSCRFFSFSGSEIPTDPSSLHKEPFYFYLKALPGYLLPWVLLLPPAILYWFRKGRGLDSPLHSFLRISLASMLVILQISQAKAACYILPALPLLFLMTAIWIEDTIAERTSRGGNWAIGLTTGAIVFFSLLLPLVYILLLVMPQSSIHAFFRGVLPQSAFNQYFHAGIDIIRVTGTQATYAGLVMAFLSLTLLVISSREMRIRYLEGARSQTWLMFPAVTTVLLILNAEAFIPAYDYQHTFKPFVNMVRFEKEHGAKIALANSRKEHIGTFTFYLKSPIQVIPAPDMLKDFLLSDTEKTAVIMKTSELKQWLTRLPECRFNLMKSEHHGYKSDYFRLIVHDPKAVVTPLKISKIPPKDSYLLEDKNLKQRPREQR